MAINFLQTTKFNDNVKLELGNSSDLEIYHDGSNSYIKDNGVGSLRIRGTDLRLESSTLAHNFIICTESSGVALFYNDIQKLTTSNTGVTVNGSIDIAAGEVILDDGYSVQWGGNSILLHTGSATTIGDNASSSALTLSSGNATFAGSVALGSVPTIATTASTFLTTSSGVISSRTAAQVRSDIGAGTSSTTGTVTSVGVSHTGNAFSVGSSPVTGSGTIAIDVVGSGSQYITGDGNLETFPTIPPTANNATITFTAGTGLGGGGTITLNQSSNETVTFTNSITDNNQLTNGAGYTTNTGTTTASNTQTFTNKSGNISQWTNNSNYVTSSGVTSVALSAAGDALQITGTPVTSSGTLAISFQGETEEYINGEGDLTTFPTIPSAANNATITINPGTGLTGGGSFTVNQSSNSTITLNASGGGSVTSVATSGAITGGTITSTGTIGLDQSQITETGRVTAGTWASNTLLNVTGSVDYSSQGEKINVGSTTVVAGKVYVYSAGAWVLADADSEETTKGLMAIALGSGTASTVGMLTRGMFTLSYDPGTISGLLHVSTTAGLFVNEPPSGTGDVVRICGYIMDSTNGQIFFNPDNTYITLS